MPQAVAPDPVDEVARVRAPRFEEGRPLIVERTVRLLACEFHLAVACTQFLAWLDGLVQHAAQRYPVSRTHRFEVRQTAAGYRIRENGHEGEPHAGARAAAEALFWRMHTLALEALPDFTRVHAGCATWDGKRFLAAGAAQSGKTTLMTRLLYEGFAVHGDDLVLLRGQGEVLPYPRRFGIRASTLPLIPQLAAFATSRAGREDVGSLTLDPSEWGFDWRIEPAVAEVVFFLEPHHGGPTRLETCPKHVMAERVMSQSALPGVGARAWIHDICALVDRAACYVLRLGDLEEAVSAVKDVLRVTAAVSG